MRVLITGATGFLGRYVVAEAAARGHKVTALVRPSRDLTEVVFPPGVAIARADLRDAPSILPALRDIEAVIHLAACVNGDDDSQFASNVVGTENLLNAMALSNVDRLVHCSTFSVYDWRRSKRKLDESAPLESDLYARDGYAVSKSWQERIVRRAVEEHGWKLTVLRPGFIWGAGEEMIAGTGHTLGKYHVVIGGRRAAPLSYVENCADCFVTALESPNAIGVTLNVIDDETISVWRHVGACRRAGAFKGVRIYMPYWVGASAARLATWGSRRVFGPGGKLPGMLVPAKFRARFGPLTFPNRRLQETLNWRPRYSFDAAWKRVRTLTLPEQNATRPTAQTVECVRENSLV